MNIGWRTALVLAAVALQGCGYTYHFRDSSVARGEEHNEWASYFLFGTVGHYELNVKDFCPNGVYEITTGNNFGTWILKALTIGIYTPRKVNIWCAGDNRVAFDVRFDATGEPRQITRQDVSSTTSGEVQATPDGRYRALLQKEGAQ